MPLYFAYFDNWDVNRNFEFLRKKLNLKHMKIIDPQEPLPITIV